MNGTEAANTVAIVGSGVAGVTAAASLRKRGFTGNIWLFDRGAFAYDRPPLSKEFLTGAVGAGEIALYSPEWFAEHDIDFRPATDVTSIDRDSLAVVSADGSRFDADRVVLALGGLAAKPTWPGGSSTRVHTVRTIEDAQELRSHLRPASRVLVVGAGLLGSEIAISARSMGAEVTTADLDPAPLESVVGKRLALWLLEQNASLGIKHVSAGIELLTEGSLDVTVRFTSGDEQSFDRVVVATGLVPDTALAEASGLAIDGGVVVDQSHRSSDARIFAIGDCAVRTDESGVKHAAGHWDAAKLDGERVAAALLSADLPAESAPWFWSDRGGLHLDVIGSLASAETVVERGEFGSDSFSLGGFVDGELVAVVSVNDPLSARHLRKIVDRQLPITAEQFADPSAVLKKLAAMPRPSIS